MQNLIPKGGPIFEEGHVIRRTSFAMGVFERGVIYNSVRLIGTSSLHTKQKSGNNESRNAAKNKSWF